MFTWRHVRLSRWLALALCISMAAWAHPAPAQATQYSPPWADMFGSQWNDLDTTTAATNFYNNLSTGYHRFLTLNSTASTAMGGAYAQSDAVWADFGHGGNGFITFCSPPQGSNCTTVLRATSALGSCSSGGVCLSSYGSLIHAIRLMVFAGCDTANDGNYGGSNDGNLVKQAVNGNGVDSAIGFKNLIYFGGNTGEIWGTKDALYMTQGSTVNAAAYSAGQDVKNAHGGNAYGYDLWWSLNGGIKIVPAAYGS